MAFFRRHRHFTHAGRTFDVPRGVFDPVTHLSGLAFADCLPEVLRAVAPTSTTAIEIGTGCGLLAATIADTGRAVIATDVSEQAVRCATENCAGLNIDFRPGDLFAPLAGARADVLVVNPPYGRSRPGLFSSVALTSSDFLERFGAGVHQHARIVILGFPTDQTADLEAAGLSLERHRSVATEGRDLGIFVAELGP